jgi:uncharacterized protein YdiU (UPF0061 family)
VSNIDFDNSYARLPEQFFARVMPAKPPRPKLIKLNEKLATQLGLDLSFMQSNDGLSILSGEMIPDGADPIAMAYAGHQFGGWSPSLGDGRAILLGEVLDKNGIRHDIQLKGSGRTPFSRQGDGRSALGPVIREYIVSEAMYALGVPTTRALAAVLSGENVIRNGLETGGVFARVAKSHVRIGTFQYFYARQDQDAVKTLADYVIKRHYPEAEGTQNKYLSLLYAVAERQAKLIAQWMSLGFIHGVMNTDNMQIAGETIDYGPCAFMDDFHPQKTFSSIDHHGRYSWGNQPKIGQWNLTKFADTLVPLIDDDEDTGTKAATDAIIKYNETVSKVLFRCFSDKLGLLGNDESQDGIIAATMDAMTMNHVDFTLFYRHMTKIYAGGNEDSLLELFDDPEAGKELLRQWRDHISVDKADHEQRLKIMQENNPIFIARNHRVAEAIHAGEEGDFKPFHRLVKVLSKPFDEQPEFADYENAPKPNEIVHETFCGT